MKPRIKLPEAIKVGDVIEIKTLISHVMETGQRKDKDGNTVPRDIIAEFTATFAGTQVFRAALQPGISANPYIAFHMRVVGAGDLILAWKDDAGKTTTETVPITVAG